jgi:hypothetical protein
MAWLCLLCPINVCFSIMFSLALRSVKMFNVRLLCPLGSPSQTYTPMFDKDAKAKAVGRPSEVTDRPSEALGSPRGN